MKSSGAIKVASKSGCVIPAKQVRVEPAPAHDGQREPKISLVKDGDRVRAIEVTCRCGEVIRIDCVY